MRQKHGVSSWRTQRLGLPFCWSTTFRTSIEEFRACITAWGVAAIKCLVVMKTNITRGEDSNPIFTFVIHFTAARIFECFPFRFTCITIRNHTRIYTSSSALIFTTSSLLVKMLTHRTPSSLVTVREIIVAVTRIIFILAARWVTRSWLTLGTCNVEILIWSTHNRCYSTSQAYYIWVAVILQYFTLVWTLSALWDVSWILAPSCAQIFTTFRVFIEVLTCGTLYPFRTVPYIVVTIIRILLVVAMRRRCRITASYFAGASCRVKILICSTGLENYPTFDTYAVRTTIIL